MGEIRASTYCCFWPICLVRGEAELALFPRLPQGVLVQQPLGLALTEGELATPGQFRVGATDAGGGVVVVTNVQIEVGADEAHRGRGAKDAVEVALLFDELGLGAPPLGDVVPDAEKVLAAAGMGDAGQGHVDQARAAVLAQVFPLEAQEAFGLRLVEQGLGLGEGGLAVRLVGRGELGGWARSNSVASA